VARRIDIELTSARPDGSWTWRAAGALQPRGVVDGSLLPEGAKAGDVLRAEAEFEIDGIVINSVLAPKERKRSEPERIELITPASNSGGVTTQLVGRGGGDRRRGRPDDRRGDRTDRGDRGDRGDRNRRDRPPRPDRAERSERPGRPARAERPAGAESGPRNQERGPDRARAAAGPRPDDRRRGPAPERGRPRSEERDGQAASAHGGRAARRLNPANTHRQAALAALPPEQRPVAEQVLRGGIPAVRTAIHLERERASAEGRPAPNADALIALAESLRPRLRAAEWRDRAEAAIKVADTVALRDLRSVVAGADLARDDEARQLAVTLRESLERRLATMREEWVAEIDRQLNEGRVVRALRASARPPEATTRLSAEQAARLSEAASSAMAPTTPPDRWAALLEAVAASPVRREVKPAGLPSDPGAALLGSAQQQAGRIPALAPLLGISIPPPPGPVRPASGRPAPPRRPRSAPASGGPGPRNGGGRRPAARQEPPRGATPGDESRAEDQPPAEPNPPASAESTPAPEAAEPSAPAVPAEPTSPASVTEGQQPAPEPAAAPEPTAHEPTTHEPAVQKPLTSDPSASEPSIDEAPASEPPAQAPVAEQPPASEPETPQPEAPRPEAQRPEAQQPEASQPGAHQPEAHQPEAASGAQGQAEPTQGDADSQDEQAQGDHGRDGQAQPGQAQDPGDGQAQEDHPGVPDGVDVAP